MGLLRFRREQGFGEDNSVSERLDVLHVHDLRKIHYFLQQKESALE